MSHLLKSLLSCVIGATALTPIGASAGEAEQGRNTSGILQTSETDPVVTGSAPLTNLQRPVFLDDVAVWLSSEFQLPLVSHQPAIAFVPARRLASLRHRNPQLYNSNIDLVSPQDNADVLSVYDDEAKTIFLPQGWSGETPAELSVLVHEMVHHIQNVSGLRFACPEDREKMAFAAQEKWLALYGTDLLSEFGLDPLTLLVRTHCLY